MNEKIIKKLIRYKMNTAAKILDHLPSSISEEIKDTGRIILESINENYQEMKEQPPEKSKAYL